MSIIKTYQQKKRDLELKMFNLKKSISITTDNGMKHQLESYLEWHRDELKIINVYLDDLNGSWGF